jgi:hypothetical protein
VILRENNCHHLSNDTTIIFMNSTTSAHFPTNGAKRVQCMGRQQFGVQNYAAFWKIRSCTCLQDVKLPHGQFIPRRATGRALAVHEPHRDMAHNHSSFILSFLKLGCLNPTSGHHQQQQQATSAVVAVVSQEEVCPPWLHIIDECWQQNTLSSSQYGHTRVHRQGLAIVSQEEM